MLLIEAITSTPSPTASPTPAPALGSDIVLPALWVIAVTVILAGLVVVGGRALLARNRPAQPDDSGAPFVRSWIAIILVVGLLVFCAVAFALPDSSLRSTLFGGLVTSVGAAVAFYFSSQTSDQAHKDLVSALATTAVPDLVGNPPGTKTVASARTTISESPLKLVLNDRAAADSYVVTQQKPDKGTSVRNGSSVSIDTRAPSTSPGPTPHDRSTPVRLSTFIKLCAAAVGVEVGILVVLWIAQGSLGRLPLGWIQGLRPGR